MHTRNRPIRRTIAWLKGSSLFLAILFCIMAFPLNASYAATDTPVPTITPQPTLPPDSKLSMHIIDVGQGDAILLSCDGHNMLVDGGSQSNSSLVVSYLKKQKATDLDYVVNTHAHEDHVGGLSGIMNACTVGHVLSPVINYDSDPFQYFKQCTEKKGLAIEVPDVGEQWMLGSAVVTVLAPMDQEVGENDSSVVLKIQHGDVSFLLMGDAGEATEQQLLSANTDLASTVLKVGHHGDDKATGYQFLREVMPKYAIVSVGKENTYGHPTEAVLSKLNDAGTKILRTDLNGTIVLVSDGKHVESNVSREASDEELLQLQPSDDDGQKKAGVRSTEQDADDDDDTSARSAQSYIGNKKTKKFHKPSCGTLPDEKNRAYFDSRDEAIDAGYVPCKKCKP